MLIPWVLYFDDRHWWLKPIVDDPKSVTMIQLFHYCLFISSILSYLSAISSLLTTYVHPQLPPKLEIIWSRRLLKTAGLCKYMMRTSTHSNGTSNQVQLWNSSFIYISLFKQDYTLMCALFSLIRWGFALSRSSKNKECNWSKKQWRKNNIKINLKLKMRNTV